MEYLLIGLSAGVLSGLFGIGGGVLIVPALILIARMKPETATGTSLAALLLPVGAMGALRYYQENYLEIVPALWIAAGLFAGAWLGASLALMLPAKELQRTFAVFLTLVAAYLWVTAR